MMQWAHAVEAVGHQARTSVDGGECLLVSCRRVAKRHQHATFGQQLDRVERARRLGGKRHHAHDVGQAPEPVEIRRLQVLQRVRAGRAAQKRAFEVRPGDRRPDSFIRAGRGRGDAFERRRDTGRAARSPASGTRSSRLVRAGAHPVRPSRRPRAPATSMEPMPFTWRSTKPGARMRVGVVSEPRAGSMSTMRPASTMTAPGPCRPAGVTMVAAEMRSTSE